MPADQELLDRRLGEARRKGSGEQKSHGSAPLRETPGRLGGRRCREAADEGQSPRPGPPLTRPSARPRKRGSPRSPRERVRKPQPCENETALPGLPRVPCRLLPRPMPGFVPLSRGISLFFQFRANKKTRYDVYRPDSRSSLPSCWHVGSIESPPGRESDPADRPGTVSGRIEISGARLEPMTR